MNLQNRISAFVALGKMLQFEIENLSDEDGKLKSVLLKAYYSNKWFVEQNSLLSLTAICEWLTEEVLNDWVKKYDFKKQPKPKKIAIIMAGNIPLVGFHDLLSVLISGNVAVIKPSTQDEVLLGYIVDELVKINSEFKNLILIQENLMQEFDAVIATGSNNSSRYFEYYFGKYPHIIRKHRNSVAILSGNENEADLCNLAKDVFQYFGLGCRNVSKLFLPKGYKVEQLFEYFSEYQQFAQHSKYFNNYEYNKSIFLINKIPHLDNGYLLVTENQSLYSPVAVLHYEFYDNQEALSAYISDQRSQIQCVVGSASTNFVDVEFGDSQNPTLTDYADNVDTPKFLLDL